MLYNPSSLLTQRLTFHCAQFRYPLNVATTFPFPRHPGQPRANRRGKGRSTPLPPPITLATISRFEYTPLYPSYAILSSPWWGILHASQQLRHTFEVAPSPALP